MSEVIIDVQPFVGANTIRNVHILASKIIENKNKKITLSLGDEGYDITSNGIELIVKDICDYNSIPYSNIIFTSGDIFAKSCYFNHKHIGYNGDAVRLDIDKFNYTFRPPVMLRYGLFYARPDNCRLYSFYKHLSWSNRLKGLATMHFDPTDYAKKDIIGEIDDFVLQYPECWDFIKKELPYSDFGFSLKYPIINHNDYNTFWHETYFSLAIEIVSETVINENSFFVTEKTFRPILYSRLFMIIGPPGFEQKLKSLGFDIFDDIIDKTYDDKKTFSRIEHIYGSLDYFLRNNNLSIFSKLKSRLENNAKLMKEYILDEKVKYEQLSK